MADRQQIKKDVVSALDILSPLELAKMTESTVENVRLDYTSGFDVSLKKALAVPFSKIARKHGGSKSRVISQTETVALKTIACAIDLAVAASDGAPIEGGCQ